MADDPVVIIDYARTPMGGFQGALSGLSATELGAAAVRAAVERAAIPGDAVDRIYMGCVLPAGLGQAPARQAAVGAAACHPMQVGGRWMTGATCVQMQNACATTVVLLRVTLWGPSPKAVPAVTLLPKRQPLDLLTWP